MCNFHSRRIRTFSRLEDKDFPAFCKKCVILILYSHILTLKRGKQMEKEET